MQRNTRKNKQQHFSKRKQNWKKRNMQIMKAESPSNGQFLTSSTLSTESTEAQKSKFHKRKPSFFSNWNFSTIFLWVLASARTTSKKEETTHNNKNTIWRGSVLTGEEPPPHSGELKHALSQAGGPTKSQLSRPMSSGHHISMEHRQRRKHLLLNPNTNA